MNTSDTYVRARIDADTKKRATDALDAMGLSVSGAIRLLMLRVADEHCLPFAVKVPTAVHHLTIEKSQEVLPPSLYDAAASYY